jgi:hypothetical protein
MPDVKLSQLAAASAASVAAGAGLWTMAGHVLGLRMEYVGPASVRVSSGSAWIPGLQRAVEVPSALTLSSLSLTPSTWYHLYLYLNGLTPAIEAVTTAPAVPYSGTARAKTGDIARRYIGSFRTNASGQVFNFYCDGATVRWLDNAIAAFFRALANGTATSGTNVSLSNFIPATSTQALIRATNTAPAGQPGFGVGPPGAMAYPVDAAQSVYAEVPTDGSQNIQYAYGSAPSGGSAYIDVFGWRLER